MVQWWIVPPASKHWLGLCTAWTWDSKLRKDHSRLGWYAVQSYPSADSPSALRVNWSQTETSIQLEGFKAEDLRTLRFRAVVVAVFDLFDGVAEVFGGSMGRVVEQVYDCLLLSLSRNHRMDRPPMDGLRSVVRRDIQPQTAFLRVLEMKFETA